MIPSMNIERYDRLENQFYNYFSQISKLFNDPDGFINFLVNDTGYFDLPASTNRNCNYKGGLLEHSLNTTKILVDFNYFIANKMYTLEQCILSGLFHNLNLSYSNGLFAFIWDMDKNWIKNPEVKELDLFLDNNEILLNFTNKKNINNDLQLNMLLNFAIFWTSSLEPHVDYKTLELEELILQDDYL